MSIESCDRWSFLTVTFGRYCSVLIPTGFRIIFKITVPAFKTILTSVANSNGPYIFSNALLVLVISLAFPPQNLILKIILDPPLF
jgi:hypothetical protein